MLYYKRLFIAISLSAILLLLLSGCLESSSEQSSQCDPGETDDCSCEGGGEGTKVCDDDGEWGECDDCVGPVDGDSADCPLGYTWDGGMCLPDNINECPDGYYWNGSDCEPSGDVDQCPPGFYWDGRSCVPGEAPDGDDTPDGDSIPDGDDVADGDNDIDQCQPDCRDAICGDDGCGGSCGECSVGTCVEGQCVGEEGQPPRILEFATDVNSLTEGEYVTFTAVVTDPDGIDDLIGGSLKDQVGGATYGAFATAASEGAYVLRLDWEDIDHVRDIHFISPEARSFQAVFFDQGGNSVAQSIDITLTCGSDGACNGHCTDLDTTSNCGACSNSCRYDQVCRSRECRCPSGETECSGECLDTDTDDDNCGSCGNHCTHGMNCRRGICKCPDGSTDVMSDIDNCGLCGNECEEIAGGNTTCTDGECNSSCVGTEVICDGYCVDFTSDEYNCGECGRECYDVTWQYGEPDTYDNSGYQRHTEGCENERCIIKIQRNWPPHQASNAWSCDDICNSWGMRCAPVRPIDSCYYYYHGIAMPLEGNGVGCAVFGDYTDEDLTEAQITSSCGDSVLQGNDENWSRMTQECYCMEDVPNQPIEIVSPGDYNVDIYGDDVVVFNIGPIQSETIEAWTSDGADGCPGDTVMALYDYQSSLLVDDDDGGSGSCSYLTYSAISGSEYILQVWSYYGSDISDVVVSIRW